MKLPTKVLVCGSRDWGGPHTQIGLRIHQLPRGTEILHGGAQGVDTIADYQARGLGYPVRVFPANWPKYGRRAGILRNLEMLDEEPDLVLAFFWDGESPGTRHTIQEAHRRGIPTEIVKA